MALLNLDFFSGVLGMDTQLCVILPEDRTAARVERCVKDHPVLYLLHGHSGDHSAYIRRSNIELLCAERDLIVVMPNCHRGFYTDSEAGYKYFSFLAHELPDAVQSFFHVSPRREDTYIAGISMGGYGAFKLALSYPERYAAAVSISGALEPETLISDKPAFAVSDFNSNIRNVFATSSEECSLKALVASAAGSTNTLPKLYQFCGTEDMLFDSNRRFADYMEATYPADKFRFATAPGIHNWEYWNRILPEVIDLLASI